MTLEARIYQALAPLLANRVFPLKAPPDVVRPYCVQAPISNSSTYTLSTATNKDRRLMQLDLYSDAAASYDTHTALAKQVRFALEKVGGRLSSEGSDFEADTQLYRTRLDFHFWDKPA